MGRALAALTAAALAAGALAAAVGGAGAHTVTIEAVQYAPAQLTVRAGERVVWVNQDPFPHTVTADNKAFDSGSIAANGSWTFIAKKPGEYGYHCTFHPTMKGLLTVQ